MSYSKKNTKKKIFFVLNTNVMFGAELVNLEIINSLRDKYDFYWVSQSGDVDSFLIDSNIKVGEREGTIIDKGVILNESYL